MKPSIVISKISKKAWVAFVGGIEKRFSVTAPTKKVRFDLVSRGHVHFFAIDLPQVEMAVFISAFVVGVKESGVCGKIGNRVGALFG